MPETTTPQFKLTVPITGYTIRKDASGVDKYVLTGMASNTKVDLTGERMAKTAITAMMKSIETSPVMLNNEHGSDWDDDFGEVTKLWSTDNSEMMMEAEADPDHYRTKTLIRALDKGKKLGLSIGGVVKDAGWEYAEDLGRKVLTYKDISLFHVAITGTPAVADTWVAPITKSMKDWKEPPMPEIKKTDEATADAPVEVVAEVAVEEKPLTDAPTDQRTVADVEDEQKVEAPAEGEAPEAPEPDTTPPSDTKEAEEPAEVTTDPEPASTPAAPEAPEQKDDAPASAEAAPAPAEEGTSEVTTKSTAFASWAEVGLVTDSIEQLSYALQDYVWTVLVDPGAPEEAPTPASDKLAAISASLGDFKTLVLKVATALVDDSNADAVKSAAEAFKANAPEAISKSLTEKDAKVAELTKSLSEKDTELETVRKSLAEKTTELEKITARKALAFGTFDVVTKDAKTPDSDGTSVAEAWSQQLFGATK
jgi:phage head maturation protease